MERYRRAAITGMAAVSAKVITVLTTLISVPLTIHYLGEERYGLWMTISSVIAILGCMDLGIGNGLVNALSESEGKSDRERACVSVSSAFFILLGIAVLAAVGFALVYPYIPWARILNLQSPQAILDAGPATAVLGVVFLLNLPLGIVQSVQTGCQEGFKSHFWNAFGALVGLTAVLLAIASEKGLPWLVLAIAGGPIIGVLVNWVFFFGRARPWLFPRLECFHWASSIRIVRTGLSFLALQVFTIIASASDNIVIAHVVGVSAVAGYAVIQRLYSMALVTQYFTAPLWPAFGEAMSRGDYAWARKTLNRMLLLNFAMGTLSGVFLLALGRPLIAWWLGPGLVPSFSLVAGFAVASVLASCGGALATFMNNGPLLNKQMFFYGAAALVALALKVSLAHYWNVAGVIWATVIAFGILYVGPSLYLARNFFRQVQMRN
jgi:O-antigen/teichoic acid export membrane protein